MKFIVLVLLLLSSHRLYAQVDGKHSPIEVLRYSIDPYYIDTSVQRGTSLKFDYISNFDYFQRVFLYSGFVSYDYGFSTKRYRDFSPDLDTISHSSLDFGFLVGVHLYTNIRSSLYLLMGLGQTRYSYSDSAIEYQDVSFSGQTTHFVTGLSTRIFFKKNWNLHIERHVRRVFYSSSATPIQDNSKAHNIDTERYYIGISHKFNLGKFVNKVL